MAGHEDYWNMDISVEQFALQIESVQARHLYVQDQTSRRGGGLVPQKILGCREGLNSKANRSDQAIQSNPDGSVVVDDIHDRLFCNHAAVGQWQPGCHQLLVSSIPLKSTSTRPGSVSSLTERVYW